MYIEKLTIKNFRCLPQGKVNFNAPGSSRQTGVEPPRLPNVNLLIGNNGAGKTSIFQALTLAALGPYLEKGSSGFRTPPAIRYDEGSAEATASLLLSPTDTSADLARVSEGDATSAHRASSVIKREGTTQSLEARGKASGWKTNLFNEKHPSCFLVAYGANRRSERPEAYNERLRGLRYQRIASLFEPHVGLIPLSLAYLQCQEQARWSEVVPIVNQLLMPPVRLTEQQKDGDPLFDYDGILLPVSDLSDGYRLFVSWLIDCLAHLARTLPPEVKLTDAEGVAIVDEVDLFLSPEWQRTVIESLSNTFPRIQWFFSTHSALVAGSLDNENIYILERSNPYTSRIRRPTDEFEGKSVDEILVELFDVQQPRSPQLQRQLGQLAERAMQGDLEASLLYLRRLNEGSGQLR